MRAVVIAIATASCGGVSVARHAPGRNVIVVVPRAASLASRVPNAVGMFVTADDRPDLAYCASVCTRTQQPGERLFACYAVHSQADLPTLDAMNGDPRYTSWFVDCNFTARSP